MHKALSHKRYTQQPPVASFTKEVNPRLAKRPLKISGRLANRELISLVKEATGDRQGPSTRPLVWSSVFWPGWIYYKSPFEQYSLNIHGTFINTRYTFVHVISVHKLLPRKFNDLTKGVHHVHLTFVVFLATTRGMHLCLYSRSDLQMSLDYMFPRDKIKHYYYTFRCSDIRPLPKLMFTYC